jgi:2-succinyl-5-enolpyruvyl-6-hydroxy-3-cyclohexene-1-carboxylate synthase
MYAFHYFSATDEKSLEVSYTSFMNEENGPCIFEIFTPEKKNNAILLDFFKELKN